MMKANLLFLTFMACVCMLKAQQGNCPNQENEIDYNGNDITYTFATSAGNCCYLCSLNPLCRSYTFVTASHTCWLKNTVGANRGPAPGRISGIVQNTVVTSAPFTFVPVTVAPVTATPVTVAPVTLAPTVTRGYGCYVENNINYFGSDFFSTFIDSASECCNLCGRTASCVVWSFLTVEKFCYLKNAVPSLNNRQNYTNIISGVVTLR